MNTLKKFVAIIIIITLILFFVNVYNTVTKSQEDFNVITDAAKNVRDYIENTFNIDSSADNVMKDDAEICVESDAEDSGTIMYTYRNRVDLSEYILKTEMPVMPDMNKYILKTKLKGVKGGKRVKTQEEHEKKTKKQASKSTAKKSSAKKPVAKSKPAAKKPAAKKPAAKKPAAKKPAKKIANKMDEAVAEPKKIVPDAETKSKIENDPNRDLIDKNNVTKYGKDTKNGNPIVFQFDKILPDNLTYKNPNKCIHSNVEGTDNSNVVEGDNGNIFKKLTDWFNGLNLFNKTPTYNK